MTGTKDSILNGQVWKEGQDESSGAVAVALVMCGSEVAIAHVGDCRAVRACSSSLLLSSLELSDAKSISLKYEPSSEPFQSPERIWHTYDSHDLGLQVKFLATF